MNDVSVIEKEFGSLKRYRDCPKWWLATPKLASKLIKGLKKADVKRIGKSAGGHEIIAIAYGAREGTGATNDNLQSSLAATVTDPDPTSIFPETFYGASRRSRPVVALQGDIHGGEITGTVASLNLCSVIETGKDLRGRKWGRLRELARASRVLIIPWLNPDGAYRWPLPNPSGAPIDLYTRCLQGVTKDGQALAYLEAKSTFPLSPKKMAFLGCYYNDNGVNLQYDFCRPHRQPETVAWMEYYQAERPDGVVNWHCNAGTMMGPPEYYLPPGFQHELSRLAGAVRGRIARDGIRTGRLSWAGLPGLGKPVLDQSTAIYHVCGGVPILCELPSGTANAPYTPDEMLDIGLVAIEEVLAYAHSDGLRPYEYWEKVKARMGKRPSRTKG